MKTTKISAAENAYAEGFESASEWIEREAPDGESASAWRVRCRANIVSNYESGGQCALCPAGTDHGHFLSLLAEWDRGFDEVVALGSKGAGENGKSEMTDVDRLTAAFDAMSPWARGLILELAQVYAVDFPAPKPAPHVPAGPAGRTAASQSSA
jgi:hypothetical protein